MDVETEPGGRKQRPDGPNTRVIAVANQKGGVGKSTTAVSLGGALSEMGFEVLVVDLDPQGNASTGMGVRHMARETTTYEVLLAEADIDDAIVETPLERLSAVPSTIDLAGAEIELVSQFSRELRLRRALDPVRRGRFDFILLDCPPSLGLLTVNALAAASELIVPIQCEYYALEGLGQLLRNVRLVQQNVNPHLMLSGIVLTMFDPRTKLSEQVVAEVRRYFGRRVYDTVIPRTVRLSEAPGFGQPITVYDPSSKGARTYRALAKEVAARDAGGEPLPALADLPPVIVPAAAAGDGSEEARRVADRDSVPRVGAPEGREAPAKAPRRSGRQARDQKAGPAGRAEGAAGKTLDEGAERMDEVGGEARPAGDIALRGGAALGGQGAPSAGAPSEKAASGVMVTEPPPERVPAPGRAVAAEPAAQPEPIGTTSRGDARFGGDRFRDEEEEMFARPEPKGRVVVIDEVGSVIDPLAPRPGPEPTPSPEAISDHDDPDAGSRRKWRLFRKGGDE
jgi:chromosome partitioning protein